MKIFCFLSLSLLLFFLCSCQSTQKNVESPIPSVTPQTFEESEDTTEIIEEAKNVAAYFYLDSSDTNYYDELISIDFDGRKWCRVTDTRLATPEDAKEFLQTQFSNDLADKIFKYAIDNEIFKEINGSLYALISGDSGKFVDNVEYNISTRSSNKIVYAVAATYYIEDADEHLETKYYTFVREKINNRWVFTEFEYVW